MTVPRLEGRGEPARTGELTCGLCINRRDDMVEHVWITSVRTIRILGACQTVPLIGESNNGVEAKRETLSFFVGFGPSVDYRMFLESLNKRAES